MKLTFPNLETLHAAISGGLVPQTVCGAKVCYARRDARVLVWPESAPAVDAVNLRGLRVEIDEKAQPDARDDLKYATCWPQILPLRDNCEWMASEEIGTVLFEISDPEIFPRLVSEILRLGNDRMSFRCLTDGDAETILLQVIHPPFYSLLGAIDPELRAGVAAYCEHAEGVWVRFGYQHPLASIMKPAEGTICLIRSDNDWVTMSDGPFHDVASLLHFELANQPVVWLPKEQVDPIKVPVRLVANTSDDTPTLWVIPQNGFEQIDQLIATSDDELLSHLSFALAESGGNVSAVIRVRPNATEIPVLVVEGIACRSYLNLPDLYLPCGHSLQPPLRRSAVSSLFVRQKRHVTWLMPLSDGEFITESLPEASFQAFHRWVDYVLSRGRGELQAWVAESQFEFESFRTEDPVMGDDAAPSKPKRADATREKSKAESPKARPQRKKERKKPEPASRPVMEMPVSSSEASVESEEQRRATLRKRLRDLETAFQEASEPLDADSRAVMWAELAPLYEELGESQDATICWANLLWMDDRPVYERARLWRESERRLNAGLRKRRSEVTDVSTGPSEVEWLDAAMLAATLVLAGCGEPTAEFRSALPQYRQHLEKHEANLPIKAAWMAWSSIARLSDGDVLTLARARDRFLRRLYDHGLRGEVNLPSFARAAGPGDAQRLRAVSTRLPELQSLVQSWLVEGESHAGTNPKTKVYADLTFAYAFARLGETKRAQEILDRLSGIGEPLDEIHTCLIGHYRSRIERAMGIHMDDADVDARFREQLESLNRQSRYIADRLRSHSKILEPRAKVPPFESWLSGGDKSEGFRRHVMQLFGVVDPDLLREGIAGLVGRTETDAELQAERAPTLIAALDRSRLLDSRFAGELLDRILPVLEGEITLVERAQLLERGILVAGHYGNLERIEQLCAAYEKALPRLISEYIGNGFKETKHFDTTEDSLIFVELFPVLRKLRMEGPLGRLFTLATDLIAGEKPSGRMTEAARIRRTKLNLHLAAGWLYLGRSTEAEEILSVSRNLLFRGGLDVAKRVVLCVQYAQVLGELPAGQSLGGLMELFQRNRTGDRLFDIVDDGYATTSSHFGLHQLRVVEAAVLGAIGHEFSLNSDTQRWLDEEEFLVRRRIHRDVADWE